MDKQGFIGREIGEDVLGPTAQAQHPRACQPFGHLGRKGPAQIRAVHLGLGDDLTFHHRAQATADGFNLGQFGHLGGLGHRGALQRRTWAL